MNHPMPGEITRHHSYFAEVCPAPEPRILTLKDIDYCLYSGEDFFSELRTIYDRISEKSEMTYNYSPPRIPDSVVPVMMRFYKHKNRLIRESWQFSLMKKMKERLVVIEPELDDSDDCDANIVLATGPLMREYGISSREHMIISPWVTTASSMSSF